MQMIASIVLNLFKGYFIKLASKEFIEYVIFSLAEAAVKNTKTPHDNEWLEKIKEVLGVK